MKPGTIIRLPDGREGTVVYHGLDGYGIVFGRVEVDVEKILSVHPMADENPGVPEPTAMLRTSISPRMDAQLWPGMECVGEEYELLT